MRLDVSYRKRSRSEAPRNSARVQSAPTESLFSFSPQPAPQGAQWGPPSKGAPPTRRAPRGGRRLRRRAPGRPGACLLWAHYMPALSVDCEQNKGPAFRARCPSGQVKLRSSLPEPFRAAPRSLGPSVHGMDRRYQGELLIRSSWHGRLRYLPQHHGYIRSRRWASASAALTGSGTGGRRLELVEEGNRGGCILGSHPAI